MPGPAPKKKSKIVFSVHPNVEYEQGVIAGLADKTGKTLAEWIELVKADGPPTARERKQWLKTHHQLGMTTAGIVADHAEGKGWSNGGPKTYLKSAAEWVEAMFAPPREALRPLYEHIVHTVKQLGQDVKVCPCQTIIPLYRKHVFAQIKPATRTRIDLGLALEEIRPTGCLIDTGGLAKGDRITHRIPISSVDDVDDEVQYWLKKAYDLDGR